MREKIWYEMTHIKFGDIYLAKYIGCQRTKQKWFKIFTLIFSTSGVLGWSIWNYAPIIACGLIAIIQIITLIENQIIPSNKDIENFSELRNKYIFYFNKLEKLWIDLQKKYIDEHAATQQFYELRQISEDIEAIDNKLHINGKIKNLIKETEIEATNYFKQYHF